MCRSSRITPLLRYPRQIASLLVANGRTKPSTIQNGTIRYKARLVIKGYEQVEGINFDETYAAVGTTSTPRYLLSFVA